MLTLGIESSCDDTSIAIVEDGVRVKAGLVSSQIEIHRRFGGVVPEVASRKHLEAFLPLLREAMTLAHIEFRALGQIAVTAGPGLLGSLLVGLSAAKAAAWALGVPLIPVNHLEAHLTASFLARNQEPVYPFLGMIVSGGHSSLVLAEGVRTFTLLGRTVDDAPGELFDKTARHLGLGYPGGPVIQKMGETGDAGRYPLPRPMVGQGLNFSFSGLKTAVTTLVAREGNRLSIPDLCACLQRAVAETICAKIEHAWSDHRVHRLVVAGGVAANTVLRLHLERLAEKHQLNLLVPPHSLCTDNAAMIAACGFHTAPTWSGTDTLRANARADWPLGTPLHPPELEALA
jgi:N6-L-threonylcarbamoyladenine synthase